MSPDIYSFPDRRFSHLMNFVMEALKPRTALNALKGVFTNTAPKQSTVDLNIVDKPWFFSDREHGGMELQQDTPITVVYDQESLDSLYGLSFFVFLYGRRLQPVACQNALLQKNNIGKSDETFIVGVDLSMDDLVHLDSLTGRTWVLAYRGSFDYLYDQSNHDKFQHVSLFMPDYAWNIGGENIEQFENTMATMISTLYFDHNAFQAWPQKNLRKMVAHATTLYATIPDYGLSKSKLMKQTDGPKVFNRCAVLMMDFRQALETVAGDPKMFATLPHVQPRADNTAYQARRKRLADHVARTIVPQAWKRKGGGNIACNTITGYSADVNDLIEIATFSKNTVVVAEDMSNVTNYYVYSSTPGRAWDIAKALKGERQWRRGTLFCVQVNKDHTNRR